MPHPLVRHFLLLQVLIVKYKPLVANSEKMLCWNFEISFFTCKGICLTFVIGIHTSPPVNSRGKRKKIPLKSRSSPSSPQLPVQRGGFPVQAAQEEVLHANAAGPVQVCSLHVQHPRQPATRDSTPRRLQRGLLQRRGRWELYAGNDVTVYMD